ncbi:hypothetical protein ABGF49_03500 [Helcococcus ovis]|nr:hypothetical protein [Helcococcus ovis]WNZ01438.1 hypothetical protein EQF90_000910 [Helcococcus ovis]
MKKNIHDYSDIINIERPVFKMNKMSAYERAAQFSPFAALSGHDKAIQETVRNTQEKKFFYENYKNLLDYNLQKILKKINLNPKIRVVYFEKDKLKSGGKYIKKILNIKRIDKTHKILYFENDIKIKLDDIYEIELIK